MPRSYWALRASASGDTDYCDNGYFFFAREPMYHLLGDVVGCFLRGRGLQGGGAGLRLSNHLRMSFKFWGIGHCGRSSDLDWSIELSPSIKVDLVRDGGCSAKPEVLLLLMINWYCLMDGFVVQSVY